MATAALPSGITPAVSSPFDAAAVSPAVIEVLLAMIILTMAVASFTAGYFVG